MMERMGQNQKQRICFLQQFACHRGEVGRVRLRLFWFFPQCGCSYAHAAESLDVDNVGLPFDDGGL